MDLRRDCIHEAGHFYVAFMYGPARAVSICVFNDSGKVKTDSFTGEKYALVGQADTLDPVEGNPRVQVSIRAAGLAAESVVYNESFESLMRNPEVLFRIKTDMDNAKRDLKKAGFSETSEEEFVSRRWRPGFEDAVIVIRDSQEKLNRIADYCLAVRGATLLFCVAEFISEIAMTPRPSES